jgi:hypothetical protein
MDDEKAFEAWWNEVSDISNMNCSTITGYTLKHAAKRAFMAGIEYATINLDVQHED